MQKAPIGSRSSCSTDKRAEKRGADEIHTHTHTCIAQLLKKIFTGMLEGSLRTCVDPHFPPPEGYSLSDIEDVEVCVRATSVWGLELLMYAALSN
jgi:hypothetical protein